MSDITVIEINCHLNGSPEAGRTCVPYYAVNFTDRDLGDMMAVVFPPEEFATQFDGIDWKAAAEMPHKPRVAVFRVNLLPDLHSNRNSWAGDHYVSDLYTAIGHYYSRFGSPICSGALRRGDTVLDGVRWREVTEITVVSDGEEHTAMLVLDGGLVRHMDANKRVQRSVTPSAN